MQGKIINDPVYGFIRFPEPEMMRLIQHPWFQRLRRIKQMGIADFVYPGAVHTRFHHSLGAAHLMQIALQELKIKGIPLEAEDCLAARQAILLHDIGHGPFSHALEHTLSLGISHETISNIIMQQLNRELNGQLTGAIDVFANAHSKTFLHQLVSSQLDMDRMDYLNRDSFYTGVSEGVIGYDRILQMLTVSAAGLVVEEKGIHSVEKFIIARRLMYWQVYLHKTVLGAEQLLIHILQRARDLAEKGATLPASPALQFFLYEKIRQADFLRELSVLTRFCALDDDDILSAIKAWAAHSDAILAKLCRMFLNRDLYKVKLSTQPLEEEFDRLLQRAKTSGKCTPEELPYFLFSGTTSNSTYNQKDERINILLKNGKVIAISEVDNALINALTSVVVKKYYYCVAPFLNS